MPRVKCIQSLQDTSPLKTLKICRGIFNSFPKFENLQVLSLLQDLTDENENGLLDVTGTF
uniref:Uncharacterized protein n=1 Tax=Daphnia galeata TaxID=27404 RepID=A0A8J2WCT8_9CRUS|nr:unnamed protein product [Daphnia galeata]